MSFKNCHICYIKVISDCRNTRTNNRFHGIIFLKLHMNISKAFAGEFVNQNSFRFSIQISTIECTYLSV